MKTTAYIELLEQVKQDLDDDARFESQLAWIDRMVTEYSEALGFTKAEILGAFEKQRSYWSANFYQESNQPSLKNVNIYKTQEDLTKDIQPEKGFRCPECNHISKDYQECDSSKCNWSAYGLFGTLGKGFKIIVTEHINKEDGFKVHDIFYPIAKEEI